MQFNTISRSQFSLDSDDDVVLVKEHLPVGVDLAKYTIEVYCYNFKLKKYSSRSLNRDCFQKFLKESDRPLLVSFEAGSSSHYWARFCIECGHKVRLITTRFVASVKELNKDDKHDAKLIYRASLSADCKTTGVKSEKEQMLYTMLKLRDQFLKSKVKLINFWRAAVYEIGEPIPGTLQALQKHASDLALDTDNIRSPRYERSVKYC